MSLPYMPTLTPDEESVVKNKPLEEPSELEHTNEAIHEKPAQDSTPSLGPSYDEQTDSAESATSSPMEYPSPTGQSREDDLDFAQATEADVEAIAANGNDKARAIILEASTVCAGNDKQYPSLEGQTANPSFATGAKPPPSQKSKKSARSSSMTVKTLSVADIPADCAPVGNVIEAGQESTGRWTKEEHEAFLIGLKLHGKEWKKVAARVKTRTVVQTRTHAQKYFQKLQKAVTSGEIDLVEISMFDVGESISSNVAAAEASGGGGVAAKGAAKGRGSVRRTKKEPGTGDMEFPTLPQLTESPKLPSAVMEHPPESKRTDAIPTGALGTDRFGTVITMNTCPSLAVKIGIPTPDQLWRTAIPPPSPAACGKRKLAELAVAQMLAGAMKSSSGKAAEETSRKER